MGSHPLSLMSAQAPYVCSVFGSRGYVSSHATDNECDYAERIWWFASPSVLLNGLSSIDSTSEWQDLKSQLDFQPRSLARFFSPNGLFERLRRLVVLCIVCCLIKTKCNIFVSTSSSPPVNETRSQVPQLFLPLSSILALISWPRLLKVIGAWISWQNPFILIRWADDDIIFHTPEADGC